MGSLLGSLTPIVTVVIPTRGRRELLSRAILSALSQEIGGMEVIVVDDASSSDLGLDNPRFDGKLSVHRNASVLGAQASRLIGAKLARGKYVALLDSDDWWSEDKLAKQLAAIGERDILVSCRVVVVKGTFRKVAPWRVLRREERVEDFLYVYRGMLQSSTIMAQRETLISLLEPTASQRIHNDTALFLEAQARRIDIVQINDALAYFDDEPRDDRISYDSSRVTASIEWFNSVSTDWSVVARKGFLLTDMVTRYVNTRQRRKALCCIATAYHPRLTMLYAKKLMFVLCNGSPFRAFR